jgi:RNA polymerase sigma-70 factor (ECF subfamily)
VDDATLVRRLIDGDRLAWEAFVHGNTPVLCGTVARVLGGGADADVEDVVQVVFAKLWAEDRRRLRGFRFTARVSTWLVAIAHREALDRLRARRATGAAPLEPSPRAERAAPGDGAPDQLAARESAASLHAAMGRLPPRDRLLVRLVYLDGCGYAEAARLLSVPENSIGSWLQRARERLKELLGRAAGTAFPRTDPLPHPLQRDEVGSP